MEEMVLFTFLSLPLIFTLVAASVSHFLTAAIKFSCYSSNEIDLLREFRHENAAPSLVYDISLLFKTGMKGDVEI